MNSSILKELEQLVAEKVIPVETADRIEAYYRARAGEPSNRLAIVLGILGSLLVGLGIVLVVAHNWDDLGRTGKTFFAFFPLALGQGLCVYTLLKRKESFAWREGSAVILFFGIGTCISLISQIYHMGGLLSNFLLAWMLLAFPLIYILPSYVVSLLYIAGITWYACEAGYYEEPSRIPYLYILLLLLEIPIYLQLVRKRNTSNIFYLHNWFVVVSIAIVLGSFMHSPMEIRLIFLGYISLFAAYYVIGSGKIFAHHRFMNPFTLTAIPGIIIILLCWSFEWLWDSVEHLVYGNVEWNTPFIYITLLLLIFILVSLGRRYAALGWSAINPIAFSAHIFLFCIYLFELAEGSAIFTINVWILLLAIYYIRKGSILQHLGILNLGLFIIAALAVLRFFDEQIPFVWRGSFFLVAGIGFFVANYLVIKKKKALTLKQPL